MGLFRSGRSFELIKEWRGGVVAVRIFPPSLQLYQVRYWNNYTLKSENELLRVREGFVKVVKRKQQKFASSFIAESKGIGMALLYYRAGENGIGVLRLPFSNKEREQYLKRLEKLNTEIHFMPTKLKL